MTTTNAFHELQYARKPHGLPTTFGAQFSFLEECVGAQPKRFHDLMQVRGIDDEYGLLNRLDNDTAGLVYFAKSPEARDRYKQSQADGKLWKRYACDVAGNVMIDKTVEKHAGGAAPIQLSVDNISMQQDVAVLPDAAGNESSRLSDLLPGGVRDVIQHVQGSVPAMLISYPIMHHIHDPERMQVVMSHNDQHLGRDRRHNVQTVLIPLSYNADTNTTTCYAVIQQGIRHQIRAHCAALGYAVVGDPVYGRRTPPKVSSSESTDGASALHLWSIGMKYGDAIQTAI